MAVCLRERERERERVKFQLKQGGGVIFHTNNSTPCVKKKQKTAYYILLVWSISMCQNPRTHQLIQTRKNLKTSPDSTRILSQNPWWPFSLGQVIQVGFLDNPNLWYSLLTWLRLEVVLWSRSNLHRLNMTYRCVVQ